MKSLRQHLVRRRMMKTSQPSMWMMAVDEAPLFPEEEEEEDEIDGDHRERFG